MSIEKVKVLVYKFYKFYKFVCVIQSYEIIVPNATEHTRRLGNQEPGQTNLFKTQFKPMDGNIYVIYKCRIYHIY